MEYLNDWNKNKIIHKNKIINFDLLDNMKFIKDIDSEYYYLVKNIETVEEEVLKYFNDKIAQELEIDNINLEIKKFIKELNVYNELKDIGQSMVHKIAERKGITSKEMFKELEYDFE